MHIKTEHREGLRGIRGTIRAHRLAFVVCFLVSVGGSWLGSTTGSPWFVVPIFVSFAVVAILYARANRARCPRCGERFFRTDATTRPPQPGCSHCGLPLAG